MDRQLLIEEIPLNPSVETEDEDRLHTQARDMRSLFFFRSRIFLPVSTIDLIDIGGQYNARLFELRRWLIKRELCIDLVRKGKGGVNYYVLVPLKHSSYYKEREGRLI